jgi:hypothetical protein
MEAGFVAGWPEERVRLQPGALQQERKGLGELPAQVQERSPRGLRAQGAAQPALPPVFSGNPRRMWLAKQRAIAHGDKAACGKESLNQEVPVAEVNASPW